MRWVDDVILGAPWKINPELLTSMWLGYASLPGFALFFGRFFGHFGLIQKPFGDYVFVFSDLFGFLGWFSKGFLVMFSHRPLGLPATYTRR